MQVSCESCGRQYQVDPTMAGKAVKCKACGNQFTVPAGSQKNPFTDEPLQPATPSATSGARTFTPPPPLSASENLEGPNDNKLRLISGGLLAAGVVLLGANHLSAMTQDRVYLLALGIGPLALTLGLAGLISPDVLRSAGKYGNHLPIHYKLIAAAVGLAGLTLSFLLIAVVYRVGR